MSDLEKDLAALLRQGLPEPKELRRQWRRLEEKRRGPASDAVVTNVAAINRDMLVILKERGTVPIPSRLERRALMYELDQRTPKEVAAIWASLESANYLGLAQLWDFWALTEIDTHHVVERMRLLLSERSQKRKPGIVRKHPWLEFDAATFPDSLMSAERQLRAYILKKRFSLYDWSSALGPKVSWGLLRFQKIFNELIKEGHAEWWQAHDTQRLRAFAIDAPTSTQVAIIDRSLVEFGGNATRPGDLTPDTRLLDWVEETLGSPKYRPGAWQLLSERAREIHRWLQIRNEFGKIIAEFRRLARDKKRPAFWAQQVDYISDARFLKVKDGCVCLMVFGPTLAIEFGDPNNAAYFFRAPSKSLSELRIMPKWGCRDFKDTQETDGIKLGGEQLAYRGRVSHDKHGKWRGKSRDYLNIGGRR